MLNFSRRSGSRADTVETADLLDKTIELAASDYDLKKSYDFRHIEIVREFEKGMPRVECITVEIQLVILNLLRNAAYAIRSKKYPQGENEDRHPSRKRPGLHHHGHRTGPGNHVLHIDTDQEGKTMSGKPTILIVDDEEHLQANMVAYLEDEGYTVVTAHDGETGLERINARNFGIGIIDMRLPGMDGNTFILKAHQLQPNMKFIIHTGSMTYSIPKSLSDIGIDIDQLFLKPVIDMDAMVREIQKLIPVK